MNRKQLIFLLVAVIVMGGAGLVLWQRHQESWSQAESKMGEKVLPHFQPNAVAAIHIKGVSEVNLVHQNDIWRVQERFGYPADFHQISDVLIKLRDLKITEANTVDPSDLARVNLDEPGKDGGGTLVEFKDSQGRTLASLLVGKKHQRASGDSGRASFMSSEADGCYVLLPSDPKEVLLISDPLAGLEVFPEAWLSKTFITAENPKTISLVSTHPSASWKISRADKSAPWVLDQAAPGETLNAVWSRQMADALAPRFVDVLPTNTTVATGLDKPMIVTIETFDPITYTLNVGAKTPQGNYYLTVTVAGSPGEDKKIQEKLKQEQALMPWIYTVGSWIIDPLLRDRAQLQEGYQAQPQDAASPSPDHSATRRQNALPGDQTWKPRVIQ